MDLNLFYSQHQQSLILASRAECRPSRHEHLADAIKVADKIHRYQDTLGAPAASAWKRSTRDGSLAVFIGTPAR